MKGIIILTFVSLIFGSSLAKSLSIVGLDGNSYYPKQLAGPPSEFSSHILPQPQDAAQVQQSAFIPMWIDSSSSSSSSVLWSTPILVDSDQEFQFSFASPLAGQVTLELLDPNGNVVDLGTGFPGSFPIGDEHVPETSFAFTNPQIGKYTLNVISSDQRLTRESIADDDTPAGYVIVFNLSPIVMVGHLSSYNLQQGQEVGLVASIVETSNIRNRSSIKFDLSNANVLKQVVFDAVMEVTLPDGTEEDVQMHDDGLHNDQEANDGIYGGSLTATEVGTYKVQAFLEGTTSNGVSFLRTTQHLIASVPDTITLTGTATGNMIDNEHMVISLAVTSVTEIYPIAPTFNGYAEVWGKDSNGNDAPACWIGGITQLQSNGVVDLVLDVNWLSFSQVKAPLTLKNIVFQDSQSFAPVADAAEISVTMSATTHATLVSIISTIPRVTSITKNMKQGPLPEELKNKPQGNTGVILVHGYCAGTNPWSAYPNDWTGAFYFLNAGASLSHDAFAQKVLAYAEANGITSYSIVGHSQGGIVGTHILNFYNSGMDLLSGESSANSRKVQSLGTPYEGCTGAGSSANLAKSFGVGCGSNFDLSLDGSKLWEPSITADTRKEVYYYTSTYELGNFFGDYCNMAVNMVLEWPNDGVSEIEYTDLKLANNMGNKQKQCHTTDMSYTAQYYDHARNVEMNAKAAR